MNSIVRHSVALVILLGFVLGGQAFCQVMGLPEGFGEQKDAPPTEGGPGPVNSLGPLHPSGYANVDVGQDPTGYFQGETSVAVNPLDPNNIVAAWIDFRLDAPPPLYGHPAIGYACSMDGGTNWTRGFFPHPMGGFPYQGDPAVVADNNGNFFLVFISFEVLNNAVYQGGIWVAKSVDHGLTWPPALMRRLENDLTFDDKPFIAADRTVNSTTANNIYVAWSHGPYFPPHEEIWLARSTDGGNSFDTSYVSDTERDLQTGAMPVVDRNGIVYVVWEVGLQPARILFDKSLDGGATFQTDTEVFTAYNPAMGDFLRVYPFPFLATNPVSGALYMAWNCRVEALGSGADVFFSRSLDQGTTWSYPINVFNSWPFPGEGLNDQFFPFVAVNPTGERISVMYYDRSDFPNNDLMHTKISTSIDGGVTFTNPVRISDYPSDPFGTPVPGPFFGDYTAWSQAQILPSPASSI